MSFADLIAKKSGASEDYSEAGLQPSPAGSLENFIQKFGHVTEEYKFYNDEITLRFNVEEHQYYRVAELGNLLPVNGVTNTVGIIDKSHMLTPWAAKMAIQKLLRIMPTEMVGGIICIKPLTFEEFTVIALEAKGAHKEKLDEASDIGHMAHKCLEDSINYAMKNDPEKIVRQLINVPLDQLASNAASSGFNWMQAHNVRWRETETKIYSREFDYAGTMDGLAICDSCSDKACCPEVFKDRLSLIDWKSSNHLKIEYLFQTASYKHAKMEMQPDLKILDTWILRLGKSDDEAGKFEPWHMTPDEYEEDFQGFLACLRLTRLVDSVEERMKSQKSTMRAVRKEQRETAKALAKEQAKLQKAIDKAAAKKAKEEEKIRIKAEAKLKREETKATKKAGVKLGSVRYKRDNEWIVTQPGEALFSTALLTAEQAFLETGWEPIEGKQNSGSSGEGQGLINPSAPDKSGQTGSTPVTTTTFKEAHKEALADLRLAGLPEPSAETIAKAKKIFEESPCTLSERDSKVTELLPSRSDTTLQAEKSSLSSKNLQAQKTLPEQQQETSCTTSTEETKCTSTSSQNQTSGPLDSTGETGLTTPIPLSKNQTTAVQETQQQESITSMEVKENPAESPQASSDNMQHGPGFYTESDFVLPYKLPMEG